MATRRSKVGKASESANRGFVQDFKRDLVKSGARVLDVFEYFNELRRPAREVEIRGALGLPKSSAHELLSTLTDRGYLTYDEQTASFFLSFRMLRIASWLGAFYFGERRILAMMDALAVDSGEAVLLAMHSARGMYILNVVPPAGQEAGPLLDGKRVPLIGTASGSAFLMTQPDATVAQIVRRANPGGSAEDVRVVVDQVRTFRSQGYATSFGQLYSESLTIAVPLPVVPRLSPLYLGVAGPKWRVKVKEKKLVAMLVRGIAKYLK